MKTYGIWLSSLKMFGRLVMYTVMSLVVSVTVMALLPNKFGDFVAQGFDLGIVLILPYLTIWKIGDEDRNKFNYGHIKRDNLKGFKIGVISCLPFVLCGFLLLLAKAGVVTDGYLPIYRLINAPYFPFNHAILPTTYTLAEQSTVAVLLSFFTVLIEPILLGIGYRLGFERISFTEQFIYGGGNLEKRTSEK